MSQDVGLDPVTDDLPDRPAVIEGDELVLQRVRNELRLIAGEWYLDNTRGLPLIEWLRTKGLDREIALARVQAAVRAVPGVTFTLNASATETGQVLAFRMDVLFDSGERQTLAINTAPEADRLNGTPFLVFFQSGAIPGGAAVF